MHVFFSLFLSHNFHVTSIIAAIPTTTAKCKLFTITPSTAAAASTATIAASANIIIGALVEAYGIWQNGNSSERDARCRVWCASSQSEAFPNIDPICFYGFVHYHSHLIIITAYILSHYKIEIHLKSSSLSSSSSPTLFYVFLATYAVVVWLIVPLHLLYLQAMT